MEQQQVRQHISVTWRGKTFNLEMNPDATLKDLGCELQRLTDVKADTLRLIVPQPSDRSSKLLSPFSDEHSCLSLQETSFHQGKSIRMMGVPRDEVDEILHNAQANLRIAGFEDEEKRMRQRMLDRPHSSLKLPQGQYIFCDFRTLHIPGIELNPPASEALKRMHMLAADPGIVAIMNKHHWRVGIMTEMAPEGYVGVSPICILGLNKNHGEEISLRLRTDDLKGFRKYDSIKRTLLHELAHMVYSEHDANFYALDKQLNQEAAALDWTRSKSHTLSPAKHSEHYDEFLVDNPVSSSHKLGGNTPDLFADVRATSVGAAYQRLANGFTEPDDSHQEPEPMDIVGKENLDIQHPDKSQWKEYNEPDPDDTKAEQKNIGFENIEKPDQGDNLSIEVTENKSRVTGVVVNPDIDESKASGVIQPEADPDDSLVIQEQVLRTETYEPDPDDEELQRIQDPVSLICSRLQKAIEMLKSEANPLEVASVLQTLFKIIRNLIEHPSEMKFKRIRKANPVIQRNVANYKAAMEILFLIGFSEDVVLDEIGKAETLLVLKRNDPGLLWLAKSSLETCIG